MEKIFSFLKNNMAIVVLIIMVVLMMCQPNKNRKVTENFSSNTLTNDQLNDMDEKCSDKGHIFDDSFEPTCHNPEIDEKWTPTAENCCAVKNGEMCFTEASTDKNWCYLKHNLSNLDMEECIKENWNSESDNLDDHESSSVRYGKYTTKDQSGNFIKSYWSYYPCQQEYFDFDTSTNPTSDNQKVKDRIGKCEYNCVKQEGSNGNVLYCPDANGNPNLNHICLNTNVNFGENHLVKSYLASGKEHLKDIIEMSNGSSKIKDNNNKINENFENMKNKLTPKDTTPIFKAEFQFKQDLKKISHDAVKKSKNNTETFSQTDDCKFNSIQRKILSDAVAAFNKGVENNQTQEFGSLTPEKAKEKAIKILNNYLAKSVQGKLFDEMIGNDKKTCFIKELERMLNLESGTIKEELIEGFTDGISYDENGRLREHSRRTGSGCYLITALTKSRLLSIGQVYQLRKLMLEAFKVVSNRPFFSFYYENFESVADMLVKENRLSEILPNMLKCIDLSKNGQFDLAFEQYILTARQAYQICKDMGMDTKYLEDKFEQLDGTISQLPEPNNLFVENGFREAIKSC